jgi:hypothetical protein
VRDEPASQPRLLASPNALRCLSPRLQAGGRRSFLRRPSAWRGARSWDPHASPRLRAPVTGAGTSPRIVRSLSSSRPLLRPLATFRRTRPRRRPTAGACPRRPPSVELGRRARRSRPTRADYVGALRGFGPLAPPCGKRLAVSHSPTGWGARRRSSVAAVPGVVRRIPVGETGLVDVTLLFLAVCKRTLSRLTCLRARYAVPHT